MTMVNRADYLDDKPLDLLKILHLDIPPDDDGRNSNGQNRRRRDQHVALRIAVRVVDRVPRRRPDQVRRLHGDVAVDLAQLGLRLRGEVLG